MARPGITYEQVASAADALVGQGDRPTIQAVREALGTGSPNTIHRHLTQWKAAQAPAERQAARLPDDLAAALAREIERQASASRAEAKAALEHEQARSDRLSAQVEQLQKHQVARRSTPKKTSQEDFKSSK